MNRFATRRRDEKEAWETISPFLDLPPTTIDGKQNSEGMRRYMNARNIIAESVKDPIFVRRVQEHKATFREMLTHDFPPDVFAKLFETDNRALIRERKK